MDEASNEFKFAIAVCLLWPQIAKNKVLGLLQLLEAKSSTTIHLPLGDSCIMMLLFVTHTQSSLSI